MKIEEMILENNFLLILLDENQYVEKIYPLVRSVEKIENKILYICLSKKYEDLLYELRKNRIDTKSFVFIDALSSHYGLPKPEKNCVFLDSPDDLDAMKNVIEKIAIKEKCCTLLVDTISDLLVYRQNFSILKFTHCLSMNENREHVKKLFIALKSGVVPEKENIELINDLSMFADKTIDLSEQ